MSYDGFSRKCYNCDDPGHIAANCRQPPRPNQNSLPFRAPSTKSPPPTTKPLNEPKRGPPATVPSADKGAAVYTEADLISFGLKRTDEQQSFSIDDMKYQHGLRTGYGKNNDSGRKIITNYVKINKKPQWVHVYKLHFISHPKPDDDDERAMRNRTEKGTIFEKLKLRPGYDNLRHRKDYATDYDVIWSTKPLFGDEAKGDEATPAVPLPCLQFPVPHPFTNEQIQWHSVKITWVKRLDAQQNVRSFLGMQPEDIDYLTRGINAFMTQHARENATTNHYETTAANKFLCTRGEHQADLDRPLRAIKALRGFALSTRPGNDDWYINIHVGTSPFVVSGNVQQLFVHLRNMGLSPREACGAFRNREVTISKPTRGTISRIIKQVGTDAMCAARTWSAFDAEPRSRDLPVFVFELVNQQASYNASNLVVQGFRAFRGLLTPMQIRNMLEFACKLPAYNKRYLELDAFDMFGIRTGQSRIADFGMAVEDRLLRIPARLLPPPQLRYGGNKTASSFEASWNLTNSKFFNPVALKRVVVMDLRLSARPVNLSGLKTAFEKQLKKLGLGDVVVFYHPVTKSAGDSDPPGEKELLQYFGRIPGDPSAPVLVVLPAHDYDLYSSIKRIADIKLGRHVVCAIGSKMHEFGGKKTGDHYLANVGMKFNLKGRGTNHAVERTHLQSILQTPSPPAPATCRTIIIGADVAHPTGSARPGCPSIAAVVGSVDDDYLHYPGSMRLQLNRQEFIAELRDMVKERLIDWAVKHQNTLPVNMLMYRDGVSESQYDIVRTGEIPQLQGAFDDAYHQLNKGRSAKSNPPQFNLTFVIVGKRHNTRFFTDNECKENSFLTNLSNDEVNGDYESLERQEGQIFKEKPGRYGKESKWTRVNHNIQPGFVVDKVITHPYREDFFLQSHRPLQGTGRSAHYFVLTNQMRLSADDLQKVTHALCYIYARATKGVSYCAPAYYADRLCDRGRAWLRDWLVGREGLAQNYRTDPPETFDEFKLRVLRHVDQSRYWRHDRSAATQYGQVRKNPWHPNLDGVMFYL